jgi:cadmium carbonic anhydrase-like protein
MSDTITSTQPLTLTIGEGTIDPVTRSQAGIINDTTLAELVERLKTAEFYAVIDPAAIPTKCVDGRSRADGRQELGANAAAGTFSVVMADALTTNSYRSAGQTAYEHAKRLYNHLVSLGKLIGGHDDDRAQVPNCGCGAEDKLDTVAADQPSILGYLVRRGDDIRNVVVSLGVTVDDNTHQKLLLQADNLHQTHYAVTGADLRQAFLDTPGAGAASIETLTGTHNEVAVVINRQVGTTLNRQKLKAAFGDAYQVFNLDLAALRAACELLALSAGEAQEKFVAALYYNVATAAVLAGPGLRVVVR